VDGKRLVSGGNWDQLVILWDMETYQSIHTVEMTASIYNVAYSPDDRSIAVGNEIGLFVFPNTLEVGDTRNQLTFRLNEGRSGAIAWSHDGQQIAFGNQTIRRLNGERPNAHLFLVDANDGTMIQNIESPWGSIAGIAWSPDDNLLAVYHQDDVVTVLESETGSILETFIGSGLSRYSVGNLAFSRHGGRLAYGVTIDPAQQALTASAGTANNGIAIVVPFASLDRLQAIYAQCAAPLTTERGLETALAQADISAFVAQLNALPTGTLPPACVADLIAVAEALKAPSE